MRLCSAGTRSLQESAVGCRNGATPKRLTSEYGVCVADQARRLSALDWLVLGGLAPLAAVFFAAYVWHGIETGSMRVPFRIAPGPSGDPYPEVRLVAPDAVFEGPALEIGDR